MKRRLLWLALLLLAPRVWADGLDTTAFSYGRSVVPRSIREAEDKAKKKGPIELGPSRIQIKSIGKEDPFDALAKAEHIGQEGKKRGPGEKRHRRKARRSAIRSQPNVEDLLPIPIDVLTPSYRHRVEGISRDRFPTLWNLEDGQRLP